MDTKTFPATTAQLMTLASKLKAEGISIDLTKPTGEVDNVKGFSLSWSISPDSITVNVLKHPFAEEGIFWSRFEAALQSPD